MSDTCFKWINCAGPVDAIAVTIPSSVAMEVAVRGPVLRGAGDYLRSIDPKLAQQIEAKYTPVMLHAVHESGPKEWVPVAVWKDCLDAIVAAQPNIEVARAAIRGVGRFICEGTVNSFLRLLMRIMTPRLFAEKSGSMISRDFSGFPGGNIDYHFDVNDKDRVVTLEVRNAGNHPYLGATGQGFCEFAFQYMGKKNVIIDEPDTPLDDWQPKHLKWRIRWS
jgi:hypothetical protein